MTPMLIMLFGVKPSRALSSDLVAAVVLRPIGAAVYLRKGTVNLSLVGWMVLGCVPMAFPGTYLLHLMDGSASAQLNIEKVLGSSILIGAGAVTLRLYLDRRKGYRRQGVVPGVAWWALPSRHGHRIATSGPRPNWAGFAAPSCWAPR
jgi:uncharacterized membrane protein YfcA